MKNVSDIRSAFDVVELKNVKITGWLSVFELANYSRVKNFLVQSLTENAYGSVTR